MSRAGNRTAGRDKGVDPGLGVLFLAAFPLVLWLFQGSVASMISAVIHFGLLALALRLIARGQEIARAHAAARVARKPRLPRKLIGAGLIGLVVALLAGQQFTSILGPLGLGMAAFGLSLAAFGLDPMADKGLDDPEELQRIRNQALVTEIETTLAEAAARIDGLADADLSRRTDAAVKRVLRLMRAIAEEGAPLERFARPLTKFTQILTAEALRLEEAWETQDCLFARRRYGAKLRVLTQSLEDVARKGGVQAGRDAFDLEADLLLERMRADPAA